MSDTDSASALSYTSDDDLDFYNAFDEVNIDVTTLITLISDITKDSDISTRYGTIDDWSKINSNIYYQIIDEIEDPVLLKIEKIIEGKKLLVVQEAYDKMIELIEGLGSDKEKENMEKLKERLTVIKSDPSEYFKSLKGSSKQGSSKHWCDRNVAIFGTSDKYGYFTLTSNISLIRYIEESKLDLHFEYQLHRSRCFVGVRNSNEDELLKVNKNDIIDSKLKK